MLIQLRVSSKSNIERQTGTTLVTIFELLQSTVLSNVNLQVAHVGRKVFVLTHLSASALLLTSSLQSTAFRKGEQIILVRMTT